ncbi:MAG: hypothetical protein JXR36_00795 [Bacteroidales bacterium]|nr:hypothetical protein [Bacteroidales bacterium]
MKRVICILTLVIVSHGILFSQEVFNFPTQGTASIVLSIPIDTWAVNDVDGLLEFHQNNNTYFSGAVLIPCPNPDSNAPGDTLVAESLLFLSNIFENISWEDNTSSFNNYDVSFVKQVGSGQVIDEDSNVQDFVINMHILSTPDGNIFSIVSYCETENIAEFLVEFDKILSTVESVDQ